MCDFDRLFIPGVGEVHAYIFIGSYRSEMAHHVELGDGMPEGFPKCSFEVEVLAPGSDQRKLAVRFDAGCFTGFRFLASEDAELLQPPTTRNAKKKVRRAIPWPSRETDRSLTASEGLSLRESLAYWHQFSFTRALLGEPQIERVGSYARLPGRSWFRF